MLKLEPESSSLEGSNRRNTFVIKIVVDSTSRILGRSFALSNLLNKIKHKIIYFEMVFIDQNNRDISFFQ